jgi:hypothetical protein
MFPSIVSGLSCYRYVLTGDLNGMSYVTTLMISDGGAAAVCLLRHNDRRVPAPT